MELDHIFIRSSKGAPEAKALLDFGLAEGSSNSHPGQGTAGRRFFFDNMMIELLWIEDLSEVQNERTKQMTLFERLSNSSKNISPFGICFRPSENEDAKAPFLNWKYKPIYLPSQLSMEVGLGIPLNEPLWFYISFATRPDLFSGEKMQPMNHKIQIKEVTAGAVTVLNNEKFSEAGMEINKMTKFKIIKGDKNLLELEFDNNIEGKVHDFRPTLPLVFRW